MESAVLLQRTPPPHAWRLVWVIGDIWTRHTALNFVYTSRSDELSRFCPGSGTLVRRVSFTAASYADVAGGAKNLVGRRARPPLADLSKGKERAGTTVITQRIAALVMCDDAVE